MTIPADEMGEIRSEEETPIGPLPGQTGREVASGIAKAAVSAIPVLGGPGAELMGMILQPAIEARRDAWLDRLGQAVDEMRTRFKDFDPRQLADNAMFVTVAMSASLMALRTHQEAKLEALKNAVINAASPMAPDEHTQMLFLRYIDELTPTHLRILTYLRDPRGWFEGNGIEQTEYMMGGRSQTLEKALPELAGQGELYNLAVKDLQDRGMLIAGLSGTVTGPAMYDPLANPLGKRFLDYISC
jgi:hypothetical protein